MLRQLVGAMPRVTTWLTGGTLLLPEGARRGHLGIRDGRIVAIKRSAPRSGRRISVSGQYVSLGFLDLHVWGDARVLARELVKGGTTSFLMAIGPAAPHAVVEQLIRMEDADGAPGARCLGAHLEGPFINPQRAGALPKTWMCAPVAKELARLERHAGRIKLITLAPELAGGLALIRWCRTHRIIASLGHTDADAAMAQRAINAGATAVTHLFSAMPPFHHRAPGLVGAALVDPRVTGMVILDGVHLDPLAFRVLLQCKGLDRIALVTDSIRHQDHPQRPRLTGGAYYLRSGVLAGSALSMIQAVRNAAVFGKISISDAVGLATEVPARLLGLSRHLGSLREGGRADVTVFDRRFTVSLTMVGGSVVYKRTRENT